MTAVEDPIMAAFPPPGLPPPRGRLVLTFRAARHLVQGAANRTPLGVTDIAVDDVDVRDDGISARVRLIAPYPNGPLSTALGEFRRSVAHDVSRLSGRPLRHLDVVVTDLVVDVDNGRRVL